MMYWFMSMCHNKDISNNVIFAFKTTLLSERHLMTCINTNTHMSCHYYEGVIMSVLCTPLQVKCYCKVLNRKKVQKAKSPRTSKVQNV